MSEPTTTHKTLAAAPPRRMSDEIGELAGALAKAQGALRNPPKRLTP